jgi:hypothetical protein
MNGLASYKTIACHNFTYRRAASPYGNEYNFPQRVTADVGQLAQPARRLPTAAVTVLGETH